MSTPPPENNPHIPTPTNNTRTNTGRRGLPGWAWALLGALVVVAVVIAGIIIAGRNTANPHPAGTPTLIPTASTTSSGTTVPDTPTATATVTVSPLFLPSASASASISTGPTQVGEWTVEILEYSPDVNDILAAADQPVYIEGHKYVGVKLRITNDGADRADPYVDLDRYIIGISNGAYYEHHMETASYMGDEYLSAVPQLYPGETGEGWLYYQVPGDFTPTVMSFQDQRTDPDPPETFILIPTTN
ncbi:hypothetical protein [Actinobaculum sp. 352]|uniref:hypothetical protein n=1 Tax=Actinobaculum sp. 352 TaxID=2490946 RepID=UPI000F7E51BF|nr:hypothetical protein [Actinobaculum sp. 352]RTE49504.1 hypothetical protein EKN07_05465 [Actinobaculum sp. 352]